MHSQQVQNSLLLTISLHKHAPGHSLVACMAYVKVHTVSAYVQSAMPSIGAGNDFQKDKQFRKLNAQKDIVELTVVRGGSNKLIRNTEVVVGDVLVLTTGDKVTAGTIAPPLVVRAMHECVVLSKAAAAACSVACVQSGIKR